MSAFRVTVGANVHARRRIVSSCKGVCSINSRAVRHIRRTVESRAGKAENDANCESLEDEFRKRLIDKEKFPTRRTGLVPNNEHRPLAGPVPRTFFALKSRGGRNKPRPLVSAPIFVIKCWSN